MKAAPRFFIAGTFLSVSAFGYAQSESAAMSDEEMKAEGPRIEVTAVSENGMLKLNDVSQTGSRLGIPLRDLPVSVEVVDNLSMQTRGSRTAVEAVQGATGMIGGNAWGSMPLFATRGFADNAVTVLYNGVQQNAASQHSRPLDTWNLDHVEVLKGPASVLYGNGAVGGTINYISKKPSYQNLESEAMLSYGSWNSSRIGVGIGGPIKERELGFRFDASRASTNGYVDRSDNSMYDITGTLGWKNNQGLSLAFEVDRLGNSDHNYYGTPLINGAIDPGIRRVNYNIQDAQADSKDLRLLAKLDWKLSDFFQLHNETYRYSHRLTWRNVEDFLYNPATGMIDYSDGIYAFKHDDKLLGNRLETRFTHELAGHANRFAIGIDVSRNTLERLGAADRPLASVSVYNPAPRFGGADDYSAAGGGSAREITLTQRAVFTEDAFDVSDNIKLVGGLRSDRITLDRDDRFVPANDFSRQYNSVSARLGTVYELVPGAHVYAQYSNAYSPPKSSLASIAASTKDLDMEKSRQYEIGFKRKFKNAELTVAYFDIVKSNILTNAIINGARTAQQVGQQSSRGIELSTAIRRQFGWELEGNLAYTRARYDTFNDGSGVSGVISRTGNRPPNIPKVIANVWANHRWDEGFILGAGVRHVGDRAYDRANTIFMPGYTTIDAVLAYEQKKYRIELRGRNLSNRLYTAWTTVDGAGEEFRLADPRSVEVTLSGKF
jgi:iron complex outermembrane receptor protein